MKTEMKIQTLDAYTEQKYCKIISIQAYDSEKTIKEIHRHSFYQILLLRKGSIRHFIDFEWREAKAPYISVLYPKQIHEVKLSEDAEADVIMFNPSVFCTSLLTNDLQEYNIDLKSRLNHIPNIPEKEWSAIESMADHMKDIYDEDSLINEAQIKLLTNVIILKAISIAPMLYNFGKIDRDLPLYQKFRTLLNQDFVAQKKVQDYAKELRTSTKKLSIISRKYTGHTPLELIHERLSLELKRMIVEDGLMLKDIAVRLDFSSQPALNKFIERQFGYSPQKFKEKLEEDMWGTTHCDEEKRED